MDLKKLIREYPDFPKPGINFKDISPIIKSHEAMSYIADEIALHFGDYNIDFIAGAESRGFIFGNILAYKLKKGLIMIRKAGKLPGDTHRIDYDIEYGNAVMEIQRDAITPGQNILLIDDLLATGGTAAATETLIEQSGGNVIGHAFVIELAFLNGREKLRQKNIKTLIQY